MMHSTSSLYDMLKDNLAQINSQIAATTENTEKVIAALPYPDLATVYTMRDGSGKPVLADLIAAKAQVLSAMAALKAADMQQRGKR